jgi:hypothetical protein
MLLCSIAFFQWVFSSRCREGGVAFLEILSYSLNTSHSGGIPNAKENVVASDSDSWSYGQR